jgi:hypothetical protein
MSPEAIVHALSESPTLQALGIAAMILFFGFRLLHGIGPDSPFTPYAIQILALIIILPVVLTLVLMAKFPSEAATGLIGTIVGFFFGGAHRQQGTASGRSQSARVTGPGPRTESKSQRWQ